MVKVIAVALLNGILLALLAFTLQPDYRGKLQIDRKAFLQGLVSAIALYGIWSLVQAILRRRQAA